MHLTRRWVAKKRPSGAATPLRKATIAMDRGDGISRPLLAPGAGRRGWGRIVNRHAEREEEHDCQDDDCGHSHGNRDASATRCRLEGRRDVRAGEFGLLVRPR